MIADREDPNVRRLTLTMLALATMALELAVAEPGRPQWLSVLTTLSLLIAPATAMAWFLGRRARLDPSPRKSSHSKQTLSASPIVILIVLFVLPFVGRLGHQMGAGRGLMLELILVAALRNLGLGLGVLAYRPACARLGAIISLFLALVSASLGDAVLVIALLGAYAVAATSWLMLVYWTGLGLVMSDDRSKGLPWSATGWVFVIVMLCAVAAVGPSRAATALAGLIPTSGGTDGKDSEARGGVNDGDNEVSASENPQSVGFTQSEVYLDSDRPSLYDTFNEMYGEPFKVKKVERMIALQSQSVKEQEERPAENLQAGREFPLVRRKPEQPSRRPGERAAKALLYIKGAAPLHLRMAVYDHFDGKTWHEQPATDLLSPLESDSLRGWLRLLRPMLPLYRGTWKHQIKVGLLNSDALTVPPHLVRFRMGSVDRPDFFGLAQDGILRMIGRTVPAGTVIETESQTVDPKLLARLPLLPAPDQHSVEFKVDPEVAKLGRTWVAGLPRGWVQVEAVVDALRAGYRLDGGTTPTDAQRADPVGAFLLQSHRGPDYQFASAAVVLLRSLGYRARLVSGFYASPRRYDVRTRHTSVLREDVHFWAEVLVHSGTWATIEPTPGYELLLPSPTLVERLACILGLAGHWISEHRHALGLSLVFVIIVLWRRREWLDGLATLTWRWNSGGAWGWCVLATLRLVERRSRWAGRPRPPGKTPARWYGPIAKGAAVELRDDLNRLVQLADRVLYAPASIPIEPTWTEHDVRSMCRRVARDWTLRQFQVPTVGPTR